jgi:hypothetical protein
VVTALVAQAEQSGGVDGHVNDQCIEGSLWDASTPR